MNKLLFFLKQKQANAVYLIRRMSYFVEYFVWVLFSFYKFKKYPENIKDVLIVNIGAIGDNFVGLRIAHNLKKCNPKINFYLGVGDGSYDLIKGFEKEINARIIPIKNVGNYKFDLTLMFNFFDNWKKEREKLGFIAGEEYHSLSHFLSVFERIGLNRKISPLSVHKVEQERAICKLAGLNIEEPLKSAKIRIRKKVELFLKKNKIKKFAVVHAVGRNFSELCRKEKTPAFAWEFERFSKIADYLIKKHGLDVIVTGSKEERAISEEVVSKCLNKKRVHDASGEFSIEEFASLINEAEVVVSIDTSAVHIAEFTDTPVVALFGPSFFEEVGAYGNPRIQRNLCHPEKCIRSRTKGESPDKENRCMNSISVEEVEKAIEEVIGG